MLVKTTEFKIEDTKYGFIRLIRWLAIEISTKTETKTEF